MHALAVAVDLAGLADAVVRGVVVELAAIAALDLLGRAHLLGLLDDVLVARAEDVRLAVVAAALVGLAFLEMVSSGNRQMGHGLPNHLLYLV